MSKNNNNREWMREKKKIKCRMTFERTTKSSNFPQEGKFLLTSSDFPHDLSRSSVSTSKNNIKLRIKSMQLIIDDVCYLSLEENCKFFMVCAVIDFYLRFVGKLIDIYLRKKFEFINCIASFIYSTGVFQSKIKCTQQTQNDNVNCHI